MAKKKNDENSFVFYRSFYDVVNLIPDETMRCRAYTAICEYAFHGVEPAEDADVMVKMVLTQAKPQIDANNKRREAGSTGGRGKKKEASELTEHALLGRKTTVTENENHRFPDEKPNVNENANENVNENTNENANTKENINTDEIIKENMDSDSTQTAGPFMPPPREEVQAFIAEQGLHVDASRFIAYYTANGWMVGKNKMKNWKAALRHWHRNDERNLAKNRGYDANPHMKGGNSYGTHAGNIKPQFGLCL